MEEELISKKELLERTGISYGQLYRWKRKRLIPEEWFIRRSTFTGQETFFPRDKILARIELIRNMKEDLSLDEIANRFSPTPAIALKVHRLIAHHIVTREVIDWYMKQRRNEGSPSPADVRGDVAGTQTPARANATVDAQTGEAPPDEELVLMFEEVLFAAVIDGLIRTGDVHWAEAPVILRTLEEHYNTFAGRSAILVLVRKLGVSTCAIVGGDADVEFESGAKVVARVDLAAAAETLKLKIAEVGVLG